MSESPTPTSPLPAPSRLRLGLSSVVHRPSSPDWRIAIATFLLGASVIAFLTTYNLRGYSIWSTGPFRAFYSWDEYLVVNITGLLLLPFLLIFGAFRAQAADFGFRTPERGSARIGWLFYLVMLPVLIAASRQPAFQQQYPMYRHAGDAWPFLLAFELTYGCYMFCWEFFYRGFLTFGLARGLGYAPAILLQAIGFGIMHIGKPAPELVTSFVGGAILGWLAVRARSFLPCFGLHWAVSITMDLLVIHARHGGII